MSGRQNASLFLVLHMMEFTKYFSPSAGSLFLPVTQSEFQRLPLQKENLCLAQRDELWVTIMQLSGLDTLCTVTCIFCKWHFAAFSDILNVNACRNLMIFKSVMVIIGEIMSRNTQLESSAVFKTTGQR